MFWEVNSYSYPNPFGSAMARDAWRILLSFNEHKSVQKLKEAWDSGIYGKKISSSGVGSWKASFEEFGLLYVLTRTDNIIITPIGQAFIKAGIDNNEQELFKFGVSSLLRYPLQGPPSPPRPGRGMEHKTSDILPYWFLYAAMIELDGKIYRSEIDLILSRVFKLSEAQQVIELIKRLRSGKEDYDQMRTTLSLPSKGKFYNTMNQIVVHASMNYLIWKKETSGFYPHSTISDTCYSFVDDKRNFVIQQMGGDIGTFECEEIPSFINRMPASPSLTDEQDYFNYLGMLIGVSTGDIEHDHMVKIFNGEQYTMLVKDVNYTYISPKQINGSIAQLCRLSIGQNLILSHDKEKWLYKVKSKNRNVDGTVSVMIRTGMPILDSSIIKSLFEHGEEE